MSTLTASTTSIGEPDRRRVEARLTQIVGLRMLGIEVHDVNAAAQAADDRTMEPRLDPARTVAAVIAALVAVCPANNAPRLSGQGTGPQGP